MGLLSVGRDAEPEAGSGDVQHLNQLSAEVRGRGKEGGGGGAGGARSGHAGGSEARPAPGCGVKALREAVPGLQAALVPAVLGGGGFCPQPGPGSAGRP